MSDSIAAPAGAAARSVLDRQRLVACGLLVLASLLWGYGNVAQKTVLLHVGPFAAVSLRTVLGFLAVLPMALAEHGSVRAKPGPPPARGEVASLSLVGLLFTLAVLVQQAAYASASVTNASFLVTFDSLVAALIGWLLFREVPGRRLGLAILASLCGGALMCGATGGFARTTPGDLATLLSAVLFGGWVVALKRHCTAHPGRPFRAAAAQFGFAALATAPAAIWLEAPSGAALSAALPDLLTLGLLATGAAFTLQTVAQRHVSAPSAAILVSAEGVFGTLAAVALLGERPGPDALMGAGLVSAGLLLVLLPAPRPIARA